MTDQPDEASTQSSSTEKPPALEDLTQSVNGGIREESVNAASVRDQAALIDSLGFEPYVTAIAEFLTNDKTIPPLTLSIEGGWGSGKSSFMKQLAHKINEISEKRNQPKPKMVEFNAWRHDKAEALWAAFALQFLKQISTPRTRAEVIPTLRGHIKLIWYRFNWKEEWLGKLRIFALFLLASSAILLLSFMFLFQGTNLVKGLNQQLVNFNCYLIRNLPEKSNPSESDCQQDGQNQNIWLKILLGGGGIGASLTIVVSLFQQISKIIGNPKEDLVKYLKSPDYKSQVSFVEKFHADFKSIVDAYAGRGAKVYVFIDDLDRCELSKAADLMQALNLMIANDPHIIFLLGMDREKIAASLALKQKDLLPYLLPSSSVVLDAATQDNRTSSRGLEYGYGFIEKFVQLPFQVPKPTQDNFERFLAELSQPILPEMNQILSKESQANRGSQWSQLQWIISLLQRITRTVNSSTGEAEKPSPEAPTEKNIQKEKKRREMIKLADGQDSPKVLGILKMVAPALDYNPRRLKQFINSFRLKAYIASSTGLFDEVEDLYGKSENSFANKPLTLEQLGKFTALCLIYPLLRVDLEKDEKLLANLQGYALGELPCGLPRELFNQFNKQSYNNATKYWSSEPKLVELLRQGKDENNWADYSLESIDIRQLLNVMPKVVRGENITYDFLVNVISGRLTGKHFSGFFSYDPSVLKGKGQETITVLEAEFNYLSKYSHKDGIPSISFTDGNFERFIWVLGKPTERFGFNDGFSRTQFGRDEEAFIGEGKDYFGYLDEKTYVDGAGTITYTRRERSTKTDSSSA
jgi:Cdc6-like AAA superfamily ATPase